LPPVLVARGAQNNPSENYGNKTLSVWVCTPGAPGRVRLRRGKFETGLDFNISATAMLGVSYSGQFADDVTDNAVKGRFTWLF